MSREAAGLRTDMETGRCGVEAEKTCS